MWKCPKCGRQCVGENCNFCGIAKTAGNANNTYMSGQSNAVKKDCVRFGKGFAKKSMKIGAIFSILLSVASLLILVFMLLFHRERPRHMNEEELLVGCVVVLIISAIVAVVSALAMKKAAKNQMSDRRVWLSGFIISLVTLAASCIIMVNF